MNPARAALLASGHRLHLWFLCLLAVGLAGGWTITRTVSVSRVAGATRAQMMATQLELSNTGGARGKVGAAAQSPLRETRASLARDWNLYFSAVERVQVAEARQVEFRVGPSGLDLLVAYQLPGWEQAVSVSANLNVADVGLKWSLQRVVVAHQPSTHAPMNGAFTGYWVAAGN